MTWAKISAFALYAGLLNTILARSVGTCTQGDAGHLWGILISVPFFLLAVFCLTRTKSLRTTMIACLPAWMLLLWQAVFAAEFSYGVFVNNFSACQVLQGIPYGYTGDESTLAALWTTVVFGTLAATALVYFVRRSVASASPHP
ncbi:hypothetical protein [Rhizobium sp. CSW-27]|uniref:hypothetical protein n=1 Tax=Rhizobium sp. CSW-27 TaxID=2839985 RepID=UPI001C00CB61|nr:hypothetical protein [Rhizobium sp. CSW-27]MBT9373446.1 hypothetical protein [Rhizobium sp. CSW-27]